MASSKSNKVICLAILRILQDSTDEHAKLSIRQLQAKLAACYGMNVSNDQVRDAVADLIAFCEKDPLENEHFTPALFPGTTVEFTKVGSGPTPGAYVSQRMFDDAEVDFLADAVASAPFIDSLSAADLVWRLRGLQTPSGRPKGDAASQQAHELQAAAGEGGRRAAFKPTLSAFARTLETLRRAIDNKWTVSFSYVRYLPREAERKGAVTSYAIEAAADGRQAGSTFSHVSPYCLRYLDGHYHLLVNGNKKTLAKDRFRNIRVDLIRDLRICVEEECEEGCEPPAVDPLFIPLADEDAPADYFTYSIDGFGIEPVSNKTSMSTAKKHELIVVRCHESAIHYIVERFGDYPHFALRRPDGCDEHWYHVSFEGSAIGFEYWSQKFIDKMEILQPAKAREHVMKRLARNAYGMPLQQNG